MGVRINTAGRIEVKGDGAGMLPPAASRRPKASEFAVFDGAESPKFAEASGEGAWPARPAPERTVRRGSMAAEKSPTTIKKYANRRLYHTGTSTYVTLEDLAAWCGGRGFRRRRRQVGRGHHPLGPDPDHLRAGKQAGPEPAADHLPAPADPLLRRQHAGAGAELPRILHGQPFARAAGPARSDGPDVRGQAFGAMEEQVRANMKFFTDAMRMFTPFAGRAGLPGAGPACAGHAERDAAGEGGRASSTSSRPR